MYINMELPQLYFRKRSCLLQSFPRSWQSINWYHSAWCTTYQDSTFYVSIFLVSVKREVEKEHRETPPSLHYYFLFSKYGILPCLIQHRVLLRCKKIGESCIRTWPCWSFEATENYLHKFWPLHTWKFSCTQSEPKFIKDDIYNLLTNFFWKSVDLQGFFNYLRRRLSALASQAA